MSDLELDRRPSRRHDVLRKHVNDTLLELYSILLPSPRVGGCISMRNSPTLPACKVDQAESVHQKKQDEREVRMQAQDVGEVSTCLLRFVTSK